MQMGQSRIPSLRSVDNNIVKRFMNIYPVTWYNTYIYLILPSGEIPSKTHDMIVNGGNHYSANRIFIRQPSHQGQGIYIATFYVEESRIC